MRFWERWAGPFCERNICLRQLRLGSARVQEHCQLHPTPRLGHLSVWSIWKYLLQKKKINHTTMALPSYGAEKNNTAMTWFKFPLHVYISCKVLTSYQLTRNFRTSNVDQPLFPHLSRQFQQVSLFSMRRAAVSTVSPCLPPSCTISSPPTTQAAQAIWPTSPLLDALNKVSSHKRSMLS
jgi:hypothetical protein